MKKLIKLFSICCILIFTLLNKYNPVSAASMSSSGGGGNVAVGSTFTITFNVSSSNLTSGSVVISCDSNLEVVSGKWLLSGTSLSNFSSNKGAFAFASAKSISGGYFQVTLRAKNIVSSAKVSCSAELKNGDQVLGSVSSSATVRIICSSHSFSDWKVTESTCTSNGSKTRNCSACGISETQSIAAKGHSVAEYKIDKEATCSEAGSASGICSVCKQNVTKTITAKGHYYGEWVPIVEATCTEHGKESRTCKDCGNVEGRETELAEHTMGEEYKVIYEASIAQYGLLEGPCSICGTSFQQVQPCTFITSDNTSASFSCKEGTFAIDTVINVTSTDLSQQENPDRFDEIKTITSKYSVIDIEAVLNERPMKPNGQVDVTLPLPEGFSANTALIKVEEDGNIQILSSTVNSEKNTLSSSMNVFGTYAFVDLSEVNESVANQIEQTDNTLNTYKMICYVEAAALAASVGALAFTIIKKKKAA